MKKINVNELIEHPRNEEFFDNIEGHQWEEFLKSIKSSGIINPLIITQDNIVVSGNQRLRGAKALNLQEVPYEIRDYSDKDGISKDDWILKELIETNLMQRGKGNLNDIKLANCIFELKRIYGIRHGNNQFKGEENNSTPKKTQTQLASEMGLTVRQMNNLVKLHDLIPEFKVLVEKKQLTSSAATQLGYLSLENQKVIYQIVGEEIGELKLKEVKDLRMKLEEDEKKLEFERERFETERSAYEKGIDDTQKQLQEMSQNLIKYQNSYTKGKEDGKAELLNKQKEIEAEHTHTVKELAEVKKQRDQLIADYNKKVEEQQKLIDYQLRIVKLCENIEKAAGAEFTALKGLYKTLNGIVDCSIEERILSMVSNLNDLTSDILKTYKLREETTEVASTIISTSKESKKESTEIINQTDEVTDSTCQATHDDIIGLISNLEPEN